MKIKIALLSATVLAAILMVLGGFIYFTVDNRVVTIRNNDLAATAQTIAQYYENHLEGNSEAGSDTSGISRHGEITKWLEHYSRYDQNVLLFDRNGAFIVSVGRFPSKPLVQNFRPVTSLTQDTVEIDDANLTYTIMPVLSDNSTQQVLGYVVLASDLSPMKEYMESLLLVLAVGCVGAFILAGLGGYFIAAAALRPIHQLIKVVEGTEANRLDQRVALPNTHDEVGRLAVTFNNMLTRIERSFDQQTRFVADASHEIRTPLTIILGYTNLLRRWGKTDPDVLDRAIGVIQKESLRLRKLADDLLVLAGLEASRSEGEERTAVDPIVQDVIEHLSVIHTDVRIDQQLNATSDAQITPDHLRQIITNVINNALKYTPSDGTVYVTTSVADSFLTVSVRDTGCGISAEDLPHVFDRFYRADKSRERKYGGNGLGLAIVKELVEFYGGMIDIESQENVGTSITIALPIYDR